MSSKESNLCPKPCSLNYCSCFKKPKPRYEKHAREICSWLKLSVMGIKFEECIVRVKTINFSFDFVSSTKNTLQVAILSYYAGFGERAWNMHTYLPGYNYFQVGISTKNVRCESRRHQTFIVSVLLNQFY